MINNIKKNIEKWFIRRKKLLEEALNKPVFAKRSSEELFNETYPRWFYFQEFNLLTEKAKHAYNDCCKFMFGFTWIEINELLNKLGKENISNLGKIENNKISILTEEEKNSINYYKLMTKHNRNFSNRGYNFWEKINL